MKQRKVTGILYFLPLAMMIYSGLAEAEQFQSHESVREVVENFIHKQRAGLEKPPVVSVSTLDKRLRLKQCEQPLETFTLPNARLIGNVTVGVKCAAPKPWKLYVRVRVQIFDFVVASSHPLNRGAVLNKNDVKLVKRDISTLSPGYISDQNQILGMIMKQSIASDMVLKEPMVMAPKMVKRGGLVSILAEGKGLRVRMEGKALMDGAMGDIIRVKNNSSRRELEAEVVGAGLVRVRM